METNKRNEEKEVMEESKVKAEKTSTRLSLNLSKQR